MKKWKEFLKEDLSGDPEYGDGPFASSSARRDFMKYKNNKTYVVELSKMKKIIMSCENIKQVESAYNAVELWKKKWEKESSFQDIQELERMLQDKSEELNLN